MTQAIKIAPSVAASKPRPRSFIRLVRRDAANIEGLTSQRWVSMFFNLFLGFLYQPEKRHSAPPRVLRQTESAPQPPRAQRDLDQKLPR